MTPNYIWWIFVSMTINVHNIDPSCMCSCMCTGMLGCVPTSGGFSFSLLSLFVYYFFISLIISSHALSVNLKLSDWLPWWTTEFLSSFCLYLPRLGYTNVPLLTYFFFCEYQGAPFLCTFLYKHFPAWATSPSHSYNVLVWE